MIRTCRNLNIRSGERPAHTQLMHLSVVIPTFNESANLRMLHDRLDRAIGACAYVTRFEMIFVDDGSSDGTVACLKELCLQDHRVRLIALSRNFGHEIAVAAGLDRASGDAVVLMDADLQDPPELIPQLIERWSSGVQVVYAQRSRRKGEPLLRRAAIYVFYRVLGGLSDVRIPLDTGNFRLMDRRVVEVVRACRENPRFVRGLVPWAGFRQEGVQFERDPRLAGRSAYGIRKLVRLAADGICSFSTAPLRLATWLGSIVVVLSVLLTLVVILERLFINSADVPRGFAFLACAVFFMGGVQLVMLGLIAQYIGYIFSNVQGRPLYVIAEQSGFSRGEAEVMPGVVVAARIPEPSRRGTPAPEPARG